jgi:hypothetical protein
VGIYSATFRHDDPVALLARLREHVEERTGWRVEVAMQPAGYHLMVGGMNVVVLEAGAEREVLLRGASWLTRGTLGRTRRVRGAFAALGGRESRRWGRLTYRFESEPPGADEVARQLGGVQVHRFGASAVLRSGLFGTPVEVQLGPASITLEAPIAMTGRLYPEVVTAAGELAERVDGPKPR